MKIERNEDIEKLLSISDVVVYDVILNQCFIALQHIKSILENDALTDFECIEEIVCVFEDVGDGVVNRHDFG